VVSLEFQSWRFALRSPAINTGEPPLRHSVKGRVGDRPPRLSATSLPTQRVWQGPPGAADPRRVQRSDLCLCGQGTLWRLPWSGSPSGDKHSLRSLGSFPAQGVSRSAGTSVPCSLRKCSRSGFLPRTPSAFRQASLKAFRTCPPRPRCHTRLARKRITILRTAFGRDSPAGSVEAIVSRRHVNSTQALVRTFSSSTISLTDDRLGRVGVAGSV